MFINMIDDILTFWFKTLTSADWYRKSDQLDAQITSQFEETYFQVVADEKSHWRATAEGRLAEIIVLDQFARNMFRGLPLSFAADCLALALAQEAVRVGADLELEEIQRPFIYMPYMHSESQVVHEEAMKLFATTPNIGFEERHKAIIDQFGRYPHRNDCLGRECTPEELEWMKTNQGF